MSPFVLDACVALAWFVDNPIPPYAARIRQEIEAGSKAIVPALWALEMANGLSMAERHGKLTSQEVDHGLRQSEILTSSGIQFHTGARGDVHSRCFCRSAIVPVNSLRRSLFGTSAARGVAAGDAG